MTAQGPKMASLATEWGRPQLPRIAERGNGRRICYPCATRQGEERKRIWTKLLKTLVAGVGFEPTTFSL